MEAHLLVQEAILVLLQLAEDIRVHLRNKEVDILVVRHPKVDIQEHHQVGILLPEGMDSSLK